MMWKIVLFHLWTCFTASYAFIRPTRVQLTPEAEVACELTGLIGDEVLGGDCCHFIKCDLNSVGWRFPCLGNTVWDSKVCACVKPKRDNTCRDQCAAIPTPGTVAPCPLDLVAGTCCLPGSGQVFREDDTNSSRYYFEDEEEPQECAPGQEFNAADCCCEGEVSVEQKPCIQFDFTNNYLDSLQSVHGTPSGSLIVRPGADGSGGAAKFGTAASVGVPYFSNAYFGMTFSASTSFRLEDTISEDSSMIMFHNGGVEGKGASVKMELIKHQGQLQLVAGVQAGDRVEDIVMPVPEAEAGLNMWYQASMSYSGGSMTVSFRDGGGNLIREETFMEGEPMSNEDIITVVGSSQSQGSRSATRASDAISDQPTPQNATRAQQLREATNCIEEVLDTINDLGDFTDEPANAIGLTKLRDTRKALRPILRKCKKGKAIDIAALTDIVADFGQLISRVNMIIAAVNSALKKICDIKNDGPLFRQILSRDTRTEVNTLKRKLTRIAGTIAAENSGSEGEDGGVFDKWLQDAQDCLNKRGRRKRQAIIETDGDPPAIESTKRPLTLGEDFPGSLDQVRVCFDEE